MKISTSTRFLMIAAALLGAVAAILITLRLKPEILSAFTGGRNRNPEPEEDILGQSEEEEQATFRIVSDAEAAADDSHEEKAKAKIRRGYIPLKFHEKTAI